MQSSEQKSVGFRPPPNYRQLIFLFRYFSTYSSWILTPGFWILFNKNIYIAKCDLENQEL